MHYRLVATDMDGTLLDGQRRIPSEFWPVLRQLHDEGVHFAPASGRQLYTLMDQFEPAGFPVSIIAENGTVVYHEGEIISTTTINPESAGAIIDTVSATDSLDWGLVVCRTDGAFINRTDRPFLDQCEPYYARLRTVADLNECINDEVIKIALLIFDDAEKVAAPIMREVAEDLTVAISGHHWIDMFNPAANKGIAFTQLAAAIGVPMAQTVAFGDYLNDTELLAAAGRSYAMANAHPDIIKAADFLAPANTDNGVVTELQKLLAGNY
ncbi:MAG: HAD family hydrolase [Corynebacterium sp.]|uniref:HAD family hydrolase n=1 Tax=Corynebacterium sp. TaxID=1720 RepID=UPI0026DC593E|nr:HAD family hydrolase [Corynebacterium sp.]MDO5097255.1 HAD family hydrolase [Corynebacterium sp.]